MDDSLEKNIRDLIASRTSDTDCSDIFNLCGNLDPGLEHEVKLICDDSFREEFQNLFTQESVNGCPPTEKIESLVTFSICLAQKGVSSTIMPINLLGDAFEVCTLKQCEELFGYIENQVKVWTQPPFFNAGKNTLLRVCNDLLRRLSKSQNNVFCGRIQMFLARLFPLEEKSALNLASHFNLENFTSFKKPTSETESTSDQSNEKSPSAPVDFNLYIKFWSLQDYFRNPTRCFKMLDWRTMKQSVSQILKVFDDQKLEYVKRKRRKSVVMTDDVTLSDIMKDNGDNQYFPKFLTNEKLMDLQLSDSSFRRHILVQILILFQYLTGNVKFKQSMQALNEQQSSWVDEMTQKVYQSLRECPPDGEKFAASVKHILSREENWVNWKNEGCPSFVKTNPEVGNDDFDESTAIPSKKSRRKSVGEDLIDKSNRKVDLGNQELTRLWNICEDNLESCKAENREKFLPQLEEFFAEAMEQADPDAQIDDEYKLINKSSFGWHALRLMARRSHHFFTSSNQPFKPIPEYLSHFVTLLSKETAAAKATTASEK